MSNGRIKYLQTPNLPKTPLGDQSGSGLTNDIKEALLDCFGNVAWEGTDGDDFIAALHTALYPPVSLTSISAVFTQGSAAIYTTDTLDYLKQYLVVTANYEDSTTETITNYVLSGTLTEGTSTITVIYGGKTDTFNVVVTELNTTPVIAEYGKFRTTRDRNDLVTNSDYCYTKKYLVPWTQGMVYKLLAANTISGLTTHCGTAAFVTENETYSTTWEITPGEEKTIPVNYTFEICKLSVSLITADIANSYLYNQTTGEVIFAGANTPYYNKRNIND